MRETSILAGSLVIMCVVICGGCSGDSDDDKVEHKGTVYVRGMFDLSGSTKEVGTSYQRGVLDSLTRINAAGGVKGYTAEITWEDYGYVADKSEAIYDCWSGVPLVCSGDVATDPAVCNKFVCENIGAGWDQVSTIFGWGTGDSIRLSPKVGADEKPYISASFAGSLGSPGPVQKSVTLPDSDIPYDVNTAGAPYNFYAGTDYSTSIRLAMQFISQQGGHKITFAFCDAGYCKDPIAAGKTFADSIGLEILPNMAPQLTFTEQQIDDLVSAYFVAHADAEWFWIGNTTITAVYFAKAVAKYSTTAKIIVNTWGFDETVYARCGDACVDRVYGVMPFAAYGDTRYASGMESVLEVHDAARQAAGEDQALYQDVHYVKGHVSVLLWSEALSRVIDAGNAITGPNIKAALETLQNFATGGLTAPLSYSASDHRPTNSMRVYSINASGKLNYEAELAIGMQSDWLGW